MADILGDRAAPPLDLDAIEAALHNVGPQSKLGYYEIQHARVHLRHDMAETWLAQLIVRVRAAEAERDRLKSVIEDANSVDGVTADDAPLIVDAMPPSAAWVEGYEAGQNSVMVELDKVAALSAPPDQEKHRP